MKQTSDHSYPIEPQLAKALALHQTNKLDDARCVYMEILQHAPDNAHALHWLGVIHCQQGDYQQGIALIRQSITRQPEQANFYHNLGNALAGSGDAGAAQSAFVAAAHRFYTQGQPTLAVQVLQHALGLPTDHTATFHVIANILKDLPPQEYRADVMPLLRLCYGRPDLDHQSLAKITARQLLRQYPSPPASSDWHPYILQCAVNYLWLDFLTLGINTDAHMEALLIVFRRTLLLNAAFRQAHPELLSLMAALALQAFTNEYVWHTSEAEQHALAELIDTSHTQTAPSAILAAAMYVPLHSLIDTPAHLTLSKNVYGERLVQRSLIDAHEETRLRDKIRSLATAQDNISQKVRAQYEEHPYPRWQTPPSPPPARLLDILHNLPGFRSQDFSADHHVLIAGCGTGYEPIDLNLMDPSWKITAVDLSRSSLAYAQRMAHKLNATQIEFLQGDILDLHQLHRSFSLVVSTGVLHHMADPEQGWQCLCNITRPGGVQRISLYSKRARRRILAARQHIHAQQLPATTAAIRQFRTTLLTETSELSTLRESDDFYSTSGCRDLLFHVQEHQFDWTGIKTLLNTLGLRLIGIDLPDPYTARLFQQQFPDPGSMLDLEKWDAFETQHPDTFVGMYQFWCQKIL